MRARVDMEWPERPEDADEPSADAGAVRSWLVRGTRKFAVDPRRRIGRHGQTRRMLAADAALAATNHGAWRDLVSALQRHAVHNALGQLRRADRQILTMAYLRGHSNQEIAGMLQVSVRTVSRRLTVALARLEEHARQAGILVSAAVLAALAYLTRPFLRDARVVAFVRAVRTPQAIGLATAGAVAAVALGVTVLNPTMAPAAKEPAVQAGRSVTFAPDFTGSTLQNPAPPATIAATTAHPAGDAKPSQTSTDGATRGCGGNPTDAAPVTPVGPRTNPPPHGSPVTHPGKGGCGPLASAGA